MEYARPGLRDALNAAAMRAPALPVVSNVTARPVTQASEAESLLLRQLTSPVRWTEVVGYLAAQHPDALFVEMGPGNVLTGLMKRIAPAVQTMACGTAGEVDQLLAKVA
jgi:[acyl-carrier-protein] S-malonyltransferase